jgi:hypothetical protein
VTSNGWNTFVRVSSCRADARPGSNRFVTEKTPNRRDRESYQCTT